MNPLNLLKGNRTYLMVLAALVYVIYCIATKQHPDERILALFGFTGLGFLRAAQPKPGTDLDEWADNKPDPEPVTPPPAPDETQYIRRPTEGGFTLAGMFLIIALAGLCLLVGACSSFETQQRRTDLDTNGRPRSVTETLTSVNTLWDSQSDVSKFRTTLTDKSQGISVGALNQVSSSTNVTTQIGELRDLVREIKSPLP